MVSILLMSTWAWNLEILSIKLSLPSMSKANLSQLHKHQDSTNEPAAIFVNLTSVDLNIDDKRSLNASMNKP
ncbi:hypothetical protein D3C71_2092030 [compost metagenome]